MNLTITDTLYYKHEGFLWIVKGDRLFQADDNYLLEFPKGNEVYGSKMRRFKKMHPIPHSEGLNILKELQNTIEELK